MRCLTCILGALCGLVFGIQIGFAAEDETAISTKLEEITVSSQREDTLKRDIDLLFSICQRRLRGAAGFDG